MPFATAGGVEYFYTEEGPAGARRVLFVHGLACDGQDWSWQVPALADRYRTVVVDLAGHGRSGARDSGYRPFDFARDLAELADQLGWGRVDAVGHSLGGPIVDLLATERPDLIRSLVLVDPAIELPVPDLAEAEAMAGRIAAPGGLDLLRANYSFTSPAVPDWLAAARVRRLYGTAPAVVATAYLGTRQGPWAPSRPDEWIEALGRRVSPVLSLHRNPGFAEVEQATMRHPESAVELWTGCGHWFHVEEPERFNARLLRWLASLPS